MDSPSFVLPRKSKKTKREVRGKEPWLSYWGADFDSDLTTQTTGRWVVPLSRTSIIYGNPDNSREDRRVVGAKTRSPWILGTLGYEGSQVAWSLSISITAELLQNDSTVIL